MHLPFFRATRPRQADQTPRDSSGEPDETAERFSLRCQGGDRAVLGHRSGRHACPVDETVVQEFAIKYWPFGQNRSLRLLLL